jgi:hypothetical protein
LFSRKPSSRMPGSNLIQRDGIRHVTVSGPHSLIEATSVFGLFSSPNGSISFKLPLIINFGPHLPPSTINYLPSMGEVALTDLPAPPAMNHPSGAPCKRNKNPSKPQITTNPTITIAARIKPFGRCLTTLDSPSPPSLRPSPNLRHDKSSPQAACPVAPAAFAGANTVPYGLSVTPCVPNILFTHPGVGIKFLLIPKLG